MENNKDYDGANRRAYTREELLKMLNDQKFKTVKLLTEDHKLIKKLAYENDLYDYEVMRLAMRELVRVVERDHEANHPLFQSSAK